MRIGPSLARTIVACLCVFVATPAAAQDCTQLSGAFSTRRQGTTAGASSTSASCGGALAPEAVSTFVAPRAGTYTFETTGSAFDTVLYIRDANGNELGCNDDIVFGVDSQSRVSVTLAAEQTVSVFVDGFDTQQGNYTLSLNPNCPLPFRNDARDLGSALVVEVTGSTLCAPSLRSGASCGGTGGANAGDATFLYTAPADGSYAISTDGSSFDTILYVRLGTCTGNELACNDDIDPGVNARSAVNLILSAGQTILIVVDGFADEAGDFKLSIVATPATPTATPSATITRTQTPTPTRTHTATITPTRTITPTIPPSATRSATRTPTTTRTATLTATRTGTHTPTPSRTQTPTRTVPTSPTPTTSPVATGTRTPTTTRSPTVTRSPSQSPTETVTATASATLAPTLTATPSRVPTPSPTPPSTATVTATTARAYLLLRSNRAIPGGVIGAEGRVQRGASAARLLWRAGTEISPLVEVPVEADGGFAASLTVPATATTGSAQFCATAVGITARGADLACASVSVEAALPGTLVGEVVDVHGMPVAGVDVFLGGADDVPLARSASDDDGRYQFSGLDPGSYVIHLRAAGLFYDRATAQVRTEATTSLHHAPSGTPDAAIERSGAYVLLDPPAYVREPLNSFAVVHFASLRGTAPLPVRLFVTAQLFSGDTESLWFSFRRDDEVLFEGPAMGPAAIVDDDSGVLPEGYFMDIDANDLPPGDLVWRIERYDAETQSRGDLVDELHIDVVDLGSRWLSPRVGDPEVQIVIDGHRIEYRYSAQLPAPHLAFDFDAPLALGDSVGPVDNRARWQARVDESYFSDDSWLGRVKGAPTSQWLGVPLDGPAERAAFAGPTGEHLLSSEYAVDGLTVGPASACPILPAASFTSRLEWDACSNGCRIAPQLRPAVAPCPALASTNFATVAADLGLSASILVADARPRPTHLSLDLPLCRGTASVSPPAATSLGVRYDPDSLICPAECARFENLCVDLSATAELQFRCLSRAVESEEALLSGVQSGCAEAEPEFPAPVGEGGPQKPKHVATDPEGNVLVVWVDADDQPPTLQSTYFDGNAWSAAQRIGAPAFIDAPQVAFLREGHAVAVWEQSALPPAAAATAPLPELLASMEIYFAEWRDGVWTTPAAITSNGVADAHPSLAVTPDGSAALLVWTRTSSTAGQPPMIVVSSWYDGATWSTPTRVAPDSVANDYGAQVAIDGRGRPAVLFSRDRDRNFTTVVDRNLVLAIWQAGAWTSATTIGPGFTPSLTFDRDNQPLVAFVRPTSEVGPTTQATGESNRSQLFVARQQAGTWSIRPVGTRVFAERPLVQVSRANHAFVVFRRFDAPTDDGIGDTLSVASTDLNLDGEWSLTRLDVDNVWQPSFSIDDRNATATIVTTPWAPTTHAIAGGAIEAHRRDLAAEVRLLAIIPSDDHPLSGDEIELELRIINRGLAPTSREFPLDVVANELGLGTISVAAGLLPGGIDSHFVSYPVTTNGMHRIAVLYDGSPLGERSFGTPPAPANLSAFAAPPFGYPRLSWDTAGRGVSHYQIYRDAADGMGSFAEFVGTTAALHFTDPTSATGTTQRYAVRSVDAAGLISSTAATVRVALAAPTCAGDCDGDGVVTIEELVTATAIAAGQRPPLVCRAFGMPISLMAVRTALANASTSCP